jgi:hypothetical protein
VQPRKEICGVTPHELDLDTRSDEKLKEVWIDFLTRVVLISEKQIASWIEGGFMDLPKLSRAKLARLVLDWRL